MVKSPLFDSSSLCCYVFLLMCFILCCENPIANLSSWLNTVVALHDVKVWGCDVTCCGEGKLPVLGYHQRLQRLVRSRAVAGCSSGSLQPSGVEEGVQELLLPCPFWQVFGLPTKVWGNDSAVPLLCCEVGRPLLWAVGSFGPGPQGCDFELEGHWLLSSKDTGPKLAFLKLVIG
ncbi:hypothetical protein SASPL_118274 [Salvia splendens]|uniref:Uncharacterized protein n=1 Tax=Salvia splendens TaxID=180675 RepID=A0A8X8Y011_SALSN|nr:hypothetical protein SASPL_118274 [Salvia splendens]